MEETNYSQPNETGLSDDLISDIQFVPASTGQRFLNFFIDNILMRFGLSILTGMGVGVILAVLFPDYMTRLAENPDITTNIDLFLLAYAVGIVNYLLYYTICEKAFKGYTLGKLITGTRAIRNDGAELTFKDAFMRSLSRLVPFEAFSAFGGYPWHDTWTKTMVIKSR